MKTIRFSKYHGTGNDFIMIDDRENKYGSFTQQQVEKLCDRRFGIGADGLILLRQSKESDFYMMYYNADGRESSMCGNGGRCIAAFAHHLGIIGNTCKFIATDGPHEAKLIEANDPVSLVSLKMKNVETVTRNENDFILDTGSPHYVSFCDDTSIINLTEDARKIRFSDRYRDNGINVNYVAADNDIFTIRTYERGVEDETLSCGTGTVAAAVAVVAAGKKSSAPVRFSAPGGQLEVSFENHNGHFTNIWLTGEATHVFDGTFTI